MGGMRMKKIVVENALEDVRNYFADQGYDVRTMYKNDTLEDITSSEYEAIIISDKNNTNLSKRISTPAPVIEAAGLTPQQVYDKVSKKRFS